MAEEEHGAESKPSQKQRQSPPAVARTGASRQVGTLNSRDQITIAVKSSRLIGGYSAAGADRFEHT